MEKISEADLIINPDGSVYHLNLLPEDIADTVITVGDQDRVAEVSKYFDTIELKKGKREFITHTGTLNGKRISVISTGIGTDNIDIVFNELDALVNIDFQTREVKDNLKSLDIIRLGTSGTIRDEIPVGSVLASTHGLGLDALMYYYHRNLDADTVALENKLIEYFKSEHIKPYITNCSNELLERLGENLYQGITITAPGFYAPQGRKVRAKNKVANLIELLSNFEYGEHKITNLEMETAGIYALANALGHQALSINAIVAHRSKLEFAKDPDKIIDQMIRTVLERLN